MNDSRGGDTADAEGATGDDSVAAGLEDEYRRLSRLAASGSVRPVGIGLAILYLLLAAAHFVRAELHVGLVLTPLSLVTAAVNGWLASRSERAFLRERGHQALTLMAALALLNAVVHLALVPEAALTTTLALVVMGSGALLYCPRCLRALMGLSVLAFVAIGASEGFSDPLWLRFGALLASAAVLAELFQRARNRFIHRVAELEAQARCRESALAESERRYRYIFEQSPAMICVHDLEGRILDANRRGAESLGVSPESLLSASFTDFLANREFGVHLEYLGNLVRDGWAADTAYVRTPDGEVRIWSYESRLFRDEGGKRVAIASARDVTALEEERDRVRSRHGELRLIVEGRMDGLRRLAGGLAHEFNNLLAIIGGYAELATEQVPPTSSARGHLREIAGAVDRGATLVRRVLDFGDPGGSEYGAFELGRVVYEEASALRSALPRGTTLSLHVDDGLPPVVGNERQIRQVVVDLVDNARRAVEANGGNIVVRAFARDTVGARLVCVEVGDDGPGVPDDILGSVFDPFFTTREVGEGQGLGLSVARSVVRSHGGHIRLDRGPEGGTRVIVDLPTAPWTGSAPSRGGVESLSRSD